MSQQKTDEELMMTYVPPTWHNNYDNSHLIEVAEDGTIKPKPEYQAYANTVNRDFEKRGDPYRLAWDEITSSFCSRQSES